MTRRGALVHQPRQHQQATEGPHRVVWASHCGCWACLVSQCLWLGAPQEGCAVPDGRGARAAAPALSLLPTLMRDPAAMRAALAAGSSGNSSGGHGGGAGSGAGGSGSDTGGRGGSGGGTTAAAQREAGSMSATRQVYPGQRNAGSAPPALKPARRRSRRR